MIKCSICAHVFRTFVFLSVLHVNVIKGTWPDLIRHPWLSKSFRWHRVSESLFPNKTLRKTWYPYNVFADRAFLSFSFHSFEFYHLSKVKSYFLHFGKPQMCEQYEIFVVGSGATRLGRMSKGVGNMTRGEVCRDKSCQLTGLIS